MKWEIVIGLETHAQLNTRSKMFSGAATAFGAAPNTQACAVDIALPGVLPVANREAVAKAVRFGLAVNGNSAANISRRSIFARKNYFYPDLPKGYQISQYENPIVRGGSIAIVVDGREKTVRLTRAHLEEDAGKSLHEGFRDLTGIDLNRAGTPLLEIVSEPDMRSAQEAVAYAKALHALVRWIDICDGNMQEGSFRCDANVSVRPAGSQTLGTRCEIKNLNSFRFLERAIEFESRRQIEILEDGGRIVQETRLYDAERDETRSMRTKEEAHDYRYFPDPDLLPLEVTESWIQMIAAELPELPVKVRERYEREHALSSYEGALLTGTRAMSQYFEDTVRALVSLGSGKIEASKIASSWLTGEFTNALNADELDVSECGLSPQWLASLLIRVQDQTITRSAARAIFPGMWKVAKEVRGARKAGFTSSRPLVEFSIDEFIVESGLKQISDSGELERACDQVIAANAQQVADYRGGKERAFNSLVGQVMKLTKGKANPQQVTEILRKKLASR
jgi:aspartyl-tRNA(Asn)/glutamyl-tRNA(Gln) amidotransferase subunit B